MTVSTTSYVETARFSELEAIMATESSELLYCYNRGCGAKFDPNNNGEDSCCFHPGNPVFHDAYKGWSCCNKKSIDFHEFLNIKGCTKSFHSNIKPPEPEKPVKEKPSGDEVYEYIAPTPRVSTMKRPPLDTPLVKLKPEVSNVLKTQIESLINEKPKDCLGEIQIGTVCKNSGCKAKYEGSSGDVAECVYHSGVPVFHEGMKYWSCCNKKTTDFAVFLEQMGCTRGEHVWIKEKTSNEQSNCRYDWHQTGSHVYISVYAKMYNPEVSTVEINPIRVKIHIEFPGDNSEFDKDLELFGIADVEKSGVSMLPTKVEVKLKKAEPGSWAKLNVETKANAVEKNENKEKKLEKTPVAAEDDAVDLKDIN